MYSAQSAVFKANRAIQQTQRTRSKINADVAPNHYSANMDTSAQCGACTGAAIPFHLQADSL
jgi:hypothetical protein